MLNKIIVDIGGYYLKYGVKEIKKKKIKKYSPMKNRKIDNWDKFKNIFNIICKKLKIKNPNNFYICLVYNPNKLEKNMIQKILLETFKFKGLYFFNRIFGTLFYKNIKNCIIFDCGYHQTKITCICEGYILEKYTKYLCLFGSKKINETDKYQFINDINQLLKNISKEFIPCLTQNIIFLGLFSLSIKDIFEDIFNSKINEKNILSDLYGGLKFINMRNFDKWILK